MGTSSRPTHSRYSQPMARPRTRRTEGHHLAVAHHDDPEMGSERAFGMVFASVAAIFAIIPLRHGGGIRPSLLLVAALLLGISLLRPLTLTRPNQLWFRFSLLLGGLTSQIAMAIVFFLVITPTGLARRLAVRRSSTFTSGPDPLVSSYWSPRNLDQEPMGPMTRQF